MEGIPLATKTSSVDLVKVFGSVAKTLAENRDSLNSADDYNHNHGDNMVQTFDTITKALKQKKNAAPADQLGYAAQLLRQQTSSGSGKLYADGLADASASLAGQKNITAENAMQLVQALLGAGKTPAQPAAGGGDVLGSILGGLTGAQASGQQPSGGGDVLGSILGELAGSQSGGQQASGGGDVLGSILGGLTGGTGSNNTQGAGLDINDLINAGMSFMQAKQQGQSNLDAIIGAVVGSSRMSTSTAHTQSGTLVANTLMQVLSAMLKK